LSDSVTEPVLSQSENVNAAPVAPVLASPALLYTMANIFRMEEKLTVCKRKLNCSKCELASTVSNHVIFQKHKHEKHCQA
jgi:hypothetical protein